MNRKSPSYIGNEEGTVGYLVREAGFRPRLARQLVEKAVAAGSAEWPPVGRHGAVITARPDGRFEVFIGNRY